MSRSLLPILVVLIFFASCKKEENDGPVAQVPLVGSVDPEVRAGYQDSTYTHIVFGLPFQVNVIWDADNLYGTGSDSLDLDTNGVHDLVLKLDLLNPNSLHLLQGALPDPFPSCRLFGREGLRIAAHDAAYTIAQGQTAISRSADTLNVDRRIDLVSRWDNAEGAGLPLWQEFPPSTFNPPNGAWYSTDTLLYLGFNMPGGLYGWIEVNAIDPNNPRITRYAYRR